MRFRGVLLPSVTGPGFLLVFLTPDGCLTADKDEEEEAEGAGEVLRLETGRVGAISSLTDVP